MRNLSPVYGFLSSAVKEHDSGSPLPLEAPLFLP